MTITAKAEIQKIRDDLKELAQINTKYAVSIVLDRNIKRLNELLKK